MLASIFLEFNLPNSTTWFYVSVILTVALFFKFNRIHCIRNWDLLSLFAMVPGLLLVQEGREIRRIVPTVTNYTLRLREIPDEGNIAVAIAGAVDGGVRGRDLVGKNRIWWGYAVLLAGSAYWLARCIVDESLERRPALVPNLNRSGLAWLAFALFGSLGAVAVTKPIHDELPVGSPNAIVQEAENRATNLVRSTAGIEQERVRWWVERSLAGTCHLMVVVGLVLVGRWHFGDMVAGIAAATAYLLLPYIAFHITQVHHVLPTAILLWAVVAYRKPRLAGALVGVAGGGFIFPLLVAPAWAHFYKRRGMDRFLISFAIASGVSLALAALVLWLDDRFTLRIPSTITLPQIKNWRVPDAEGFWTGVHWAYRIPVFICALAFMIATAFWPAPKTLAHLLAMASANLLAAQLWNAKNGGAYVLWYLPLLLLVIMRPTLADKRPPEVATGEDEKSLPQSR